MRALLVVGGLLGFGRNVRLKPDLLGGYVVTQALQSDTVSYDSNVRLESLTYASHPREPEAPGGIFRII